MLWSVAAVFVAPLVPAVLAQDHLAFASASVFVPLPAGAAAAITIVTTPTTATSTATAAGDTAAIATVTIDPAAAAAAAASATSTATVTAAAPRGLALGLAHRIASGRSAVQVTDKGLTYICSGCHGMRTMRRFGAADATSGAQSAALLSVTEVYQYFS